MTTPLSTSISSPTATSAINRIVANRTTNVSPAATPVLPNGEGGPGQGTGTSQTGSGGTGSSGAAVPAASTTENPTLLFGGLPPSAASYSRQITRHVQIGAAVIFTVDLAWSGLVPGAGVVTIAANLPTGALASPELSVSGFGVAPSSAPYAIVESNGSLALMLSSETTAPAADAGMPGAALENAGGLFVSGFYFVG